MSYPTNYTPIADKQALLSKYKGAKVEDLPTPSLLVEESIFATNCEKMLQNAAKLNADFRGHVKTHKTMEGTRLQLGLGDLTTDKIVVSTLAEAWNLLPLVEEGLINDILFSLPVVKSRLDELAEFSSKVPNLRIMLDNACQLDTLVAYNKEHTAKKWSVFIKINMGTNRAGLVNDSEFLKETIQKLNTSEVKAAVEVYGFYCHAGHSYASDNEGKAKSFLLEEIKHANMAAKAALEVDPSLKLQISVGATPTAHASECLSVKELEASFGKLYGNLELHAGNYPFCDLQQVATGCVSHENVSCSVLAEVVSTYESRGDKKPGEQLINAGVIALAREFGTLPGHGRIIEPKGYENWIVGRLSQEHGILVPLEEQLNHEFIPIGTKVKVFPQHSCITAAAYPWYFVVDKGVVKDIWVPFRGW